MLRKEPGAEFYEDQYLPCPALGQVEITTGQGNGNQGQESGVQAHVGKTAGTFGEEGRDSLQKEQGCGFGWKISTPQR